MDSGRNEPPQYRDVAPFNVLTFVFVNDKEANQLKQRLGELASMGVLVSVSGAMYRALANINRN